MLNSTIVAQAAQSAAADDGQVTFMCRAQGRTSMRMSDAAGTGSGWGGGKVGGKAIRHELGCGSHAEHRCLRRRCRGRLLKSATTQPIPNQAGIDPESKRNAGHRGAQRAAGLDDFRLEFGAVPPPGDGPALLMIHGTGGGFDQGLTFTEEFVRRGHRVIAPSRFAYLRSDFPDDPSSKS